MQTYTQTSMFDVPQTPTVAGENARMKELYRIPVTRIALVREGSIPADRRAITGPADVYNFLRGYFEDKDREILVAVYMDAKNVICGFNVVSVGDLTTSIANPRETFKAAILANAASIIIAHNHPSGDPTPSSDDMDVTRRMAEAGTLLGIEVLDHIVFGDGRHASLKERGLF